MKLFYCSFLTIVLINAYKEEDLKRFQETGNGEKADLSELNMTPEIDALRKAGKKIVLTGANLTHCDFTKADLTSVCLRTANCNNAKFIEAKLKYANFASAQMVWAIIDKSKASYACFHASNLSYAMVNKSKLKGAQFIGTPLTAANIIKSNCAGAQFYTAAVMHAQFIKNSDLCLKGASQLELSTVVAPDSNDIQPKKNTTPQAENNNNKC